MPARKAAVAALLALLTVSSLRAASQVEADPHELYERARARLSEGELSDSAAAIARLRELIETRPDWDPEGVFAQHLLPPLQARLNRLVNATRKLDEFCDRALEDLQPPTREKNLSTVRDYASWAAEVIARLRGERDAIVTAALRDQGEVAILARTDSYRRTERLLQVDVLERISESAGDDVLGIAGGDGDLESVLIRFRQLKRDLMQVSSERDQLEQDAAAYRKRTEAVLEALLEVITDGAPAPKSRRGRPAPGVVDRFRLFLDDELQALTQRTSLQWWEREALFDNLDRYRRYNAVLRAAGLNQDESARIDALSKVVAQIPVSDTAGPAAPAAARLADRALQPIAGALALATTILGWMVVARGRRLRSLQRTSVPDAPRGAGRIPDEDTRPKAA
ncbi:MAG TPA: hypothetical protein VJV75_13925 [Candidatus Polarisedimenticolia bacterium]|nr:hypothetical protein [Candidatus Polarisedimenticolia bacterium]